MKLHSIAIAFAVAGTAWARQSCVLTTADKQSNAPLSYDDFDQKGTLPSCARAFVNGGNDVGGQA